VQEIEHLVLPFEEDAHNQVKILVYGTSFEKDDISYLIRFG
jgi:hypothetical protein